MPTDQILSWWEASSSDRSRENHDLCHGLLVTRHPHACAARFVSPVGIFHCVGARTEEGEELLKQAYAQGGQETVRSLRTEEHRPDAQCWLHHQGFCLSRLTIEKCASA